MRTRKPTAQDIAQLVGFLPLLYKNGFTPIREWHGGSKKQNGIITIPRPKYEGIVEDFFQAASGDCWTDYNYQPAEAARMLKDSKFVETANIDQIRTMLTYCVRGERFHSGHWAVMIESGHIRQILRRLSEIKSSIGS